MMGKLNWTEKVEIVKELASEYRGHIAGKAIEVEDFVANVITFYFSRDSYKRDPFVTVKVEYCLFDDATMLTFANKVEIMKRIIECEEYLSRKKLNRLISTIDDIRGLINTVSHAKISNTSEQVDGFDRNNIHFVKKRFKEGVLDETPKTINSKDIEEFDRKVIKAINTMSDVFNEITNRSEKADASRSRTPDT